MAVPLVTRHTSSSGLAYRLHSSDGSDATTFLLLPGIGMSHRYFARLHKKLAKNCRTISLDLPGFGGIAKPKHRLSVEDHAALIGEAMDAARVASCVLIGHSMGTQFAIELARRRPGQVSHIVLIGPVVDDRRRSIWEQALALGLDSLREPPSANAIVFSDYLRTGPRWYLTELPAMMDYPTKERLRDVEVPVLVIRGEGDPIAQPGWCAELVQQATGARLLQLPGAHVVQHSSPAAVASAVTAFVATNPNARL